MHLNGAMELAPGLGLSRLIVDLVQTGSTLKANGLVETEVIAQVTSRLVVNRTALKTRPEAIGAWIARFRGALARGMIRLDTRDAGFEAAFAALLGQARETTEDVSAAVAAIIADVRARQDAALIDATLRFDRLTLRPETLRVDTGTIDAAVAAIPAELMQALDIAATRITAFHEAQRPADLRLEDAPA